MQAKNKAKAGAHELFWGQMDGPTRELYMPAMQTELNAHDQLKAMKSVAPDIQVPPERVLASRWLFTDKNEVLRAADPSLGVRARARDLGTTNAPRTDAPTADVMGVNMLAMIAAAKRWKIMGSDVSTAFLRGVENTRNLFARMPRVMPPDSPFRAGEVVHLTKGVFRRRAARDRGAPRGRRDHPRSSNRPLYRLATEKSVANRCNGKVKSLYWPVRSCTDRFGLNRPLYRTVRQKIGRFALKAGRFVNPWTIGRFVIRSVRQNCWSVR